MNGIKSYHLVKEHGAYALIIYLDEIDTEFANELGQLSENKKANFSEQIINHVREKFPRIHIPICKVMLGSLLLATVPLMSETAMAATGVEQTQSSYTVVSGDTLWKISQKFNVTIDSIKSENNLNSDMIVIGQKILIPGQVVSSNSYTVMSGDTLWRIANQAGTTVSQIKELNQLKSDTIYVGQKLLLPQKASTEPTIRIIDYKVVQGDNIWKIAINHGVPQSEVLKLNQLTENSTLSIGQIIKIPVHIIPVKETLGSQYGEKLDWWTEAQYVLPINTKATIVDFKTGKSFQIIRTIGAFHADSETVSAIDTEIAKGIWGGFSWTPRPVMVIVNGHRIAASMSFMPHGIQYISGNNLEGHFDIHFLNSTRHVDGLVDPAHQEAIKIALGEKLI